MQMSVPSMADERGFVGLLFSLLLSSTGCPAVVDGRGTGSAGWCAMRNVQCADCQLRIANPPFYDRGAPVTSHRDSGCAEEGRLVRTLEENVQDCQGQSCARCCTVRIFGGRRRERVEKGTGPKMAPSSKLTWYLDKPGQGEKSPFHALVPGNSWKGRKIFLFHVGELLKTDVYLEGAMRTALSQNGQGQFGSLAVMKREKKKRRTRDSAVVSSAKAPPPKPLGRLFPTAGSRNFNSIS